MGNIAATLTNEYFKISEGRMHIGQSSFEELALRFGTPSYIYDANILRNRYNKVRNAFSERVSILFALKANGNAAVANTLRQSGSGVEVASAGEIEIAKFTGFQGKQTHFAGPGKTRKDLEKALEFGVSSINMESAGELDRILDISRELNKVANVSIRVQQPDTLKGSRMRMSGADSKFGIPMHQVPDLVKRIHESPAVNFCGLHLYAGTQCFDAKSWIGMAEQLFDLAEDIESTHDIRVPHLNFGGGFGVPLFDGDSEFDLDEAGRLLNALIDQDKDNKRQYFIELGRYLTAPAGVYLMKVTDIKKSGDKRHIIVDGGMHHHSTAVGLGSLIKRNFPVVLPQKPLDEHDTEQCLSGPLCLPSDEFCAKISLPKAEEGDLVAILASGAYGLSFSPVLFLGHPMPAEILVDGNQAYLVRERGKPEDMVYRQSLPSEVPA